MNKSISQNEYEASNSWGLLTSIDLFNCNSATIRDGEKIKDYIIKLCKLIDMNRFGDPVIVRFGKDIRVSGYSAVQLIETSCISGHFAEDSDSVYIDIFSCKFYNQEEAVSFTKEFFGSKKAKFHVILRGENISNKK